MKMRSNKIIDIVSFMKKELSEIYNEQETISLITNLFQEYTGLSKADLIIYAEKGIN